MSNDYVDTYLPDNPLLALLIVILQVIKYINYFVQKFLNTLWIMDCCVLVYKFQYFLLHR